MRFFVGLHQPCDAYRFDAAFISVNRLRGRKSGFPVDDWIMDSGAFTTIDKHGHYPDPPEVYAAQIKRWSTNGNLLAAVSQDFMCEAHMLARTDATNVALAGMWPAYGPATQDQLVYVHQLWTIERYDALVSSDVGGVYIMPVLQGYDPADYVQHIALYGDRLPVGAWVGVGSVCKRNGDAAAIEEVLLAIGRARPDLRLHGFGVKTTALGSGLVRELLETADSMAWSFAARKQGRSSNHWSGAARFVERIASMPVQLSLMGAI